MAILTTLFFILFVIVFPIGQLIGFTPFKSVNFSLLEVFTLLTFLSWVIFAKKRKFKNKLLFPLCLFVGILIVSLIVNVFGVPGNILFNAFLYTIRWVLYLSIFFVVINTTNRFKNLILYFMIIGGFIAMAIGYFQYFLFPSLQSLYKYGWDEHLYRLFSSFLDPNFCGIILSLAFILNFYLLPKIKDNKYMILFVVLQILTFTSILLTYSRTGIITLVFSTVTFLILNKKRKLALGFVILLLLSIFLLPKISAFISVKTFRIEGTNFLRTTSTQARIQAIKDGVALFSQKPILGVGFNNLRYEQYRKGIIGGPNWETTHAGGGTDNSFLFVAETTGVIGLAAYIFLLYSIFHLLFKIRHKKPQLSVIAISSLAGVIVGSFFINGLFYPFIMLWLWSLIGATLNT